MTISGDLTFIHRKQGQVILGIKIDPSTMGDALPRISDTLELTSIFPRRLTKGDEEVRGSGTESNLAPLHKNVGIWQSIKKHFWSYTKATGKANTSSYRGLL